MSNLSFKSGDVIYFHLAHEDTGRTCQRCSRLSRLLTGIRCDPVVAEAKSRPMLVISCSHNTGIYHLLKCTTKEPKNGRYRAVKMKGKNGFILTTGLHTLPSNLGENEVYDRIDRILLKVIMRDLERNLGFSP